MSADVYADPAETRRALALLCEPGEAYELRALGTTSQQRRSRTATQGAK
jgi:hypothetical protein